MSKKDPGLRRAFDAVGLVVDPGVPKAPGLAAWWDLGRGKGGEIFPQKNLGAGEGLNKLVEGV